MDHHQLVVYHSRGPQTQAASLILLVHPACLLSWTFVQAHCAAQHSCESSWHPKIFLAFQTYVPEKDIPHTLLIKKTNQIGNGNELIDITLNFPALIKSIEEQFIRFDILILMQHVFSALKLGEFHMTFLCTKKALKKVFYLGESAQRWWWCSLHGRPGSNRVSLVYTIIVHTSSRNNPRCCNGGMVWCGWWTKCTLQYVAARKPILLLPSLFMICVMGVERCWSS